MILYKVQFRAIEELVLWKLMKYGGILISQ